MPLVISLTAALGLPAGRAQNANSPDPIAVAATSPANRPNLSPMQTLLEPVALYPDPLLALVLAASTQPGEIQAGTPAAASPAVLALSHYPAALSWMASHRQWTARVGVAFADQPARVMESIQALRHRALAVGNLSTNSQVEVVRDAGILRIVPRHAETVSLPQYRGESVFFPVGSPVQWSADLPAGPWLTFIPDWSRNRLCTGNWQAVSRGQSGGEEAMKNLTPWQVTATAQIRGRQYQNLDNTVYGRPQYEPTPGNDYGYLEPRLAAPRSAPDNHPATFPGDQTSPADAHSAPSAASGANASDPHSPPNP